MASTNFSVVDVGKKVVAKELIEILQQNLIFYKTAKKQKVSKGANSKSVVFRGFNRASVATTPLTEGVTPSSFALSMNNYTATIAQYGSFTTVTDLAEFLYDRSLVKDAVGVLGIQSQETIDTLVVNTIAAGTNVIYGDGTVSTRATVLDTMVLTPTLVQRATRFLERNNVKKFTNVPKIGGGYALVTHPDTIYDWRGAANWVNAVNYSSPTPNNPDRGDLFTGETGYWMGCRIIESTIAPVWAGAGGGSPAANVYGVLIYGEGAYAVTELESGLETYIFTAGNNIDALAQYSTVGWKWAGAAIILDQNRLVRLEVGATLSGSTA
jgi:N4-gp56 family major capsid protein